jgi:hypothetical protein
MDISTPIIKSLTAAGYHPVYIWKAMPDEEDADHMHPFETRIVVVEGEIMIETEEEVRKTLQAEDTIDIPEYIVHKARAGKEGCTYVIAERHS